jgi:hypothetical protein
MHISARRIPLNSFKRDAYKRTLEFHGVDVYAHDTKRDLWKLVIADGAMVAHLLKFYGWQHA